MRAHAPYVATVCQGYSDYMGGRYESAHRNFAAADTLSHVPMQLLTWLKSQAIYLDGVVYEAEGDRSVAEAKFGRLLADAERRGDREAGMWMNGNLYLYHTRTGNKALAEKYLLGYYRDREAIAVANDGASIKRAGPARENKRIRDASLAAIRATGEGKAGTSVLDEGRGGGRPAHSAGADNSARDVLATPAIRHDHVRETPSGTGGQGVGHGT